MTTSTLVLNLKRKTSEQVQIHKSEPDAHGVCHYYLFRPKTGRFNHLIFQQGPRKEVGINGITLDDVVAVAIDHIEGWQATPFACEQNDAILGHLNAILDLCNDRHADREARGVKGTSNP